MSTEVEPQAVKLFVGGLAWATTEESLRRSFEKYGTIERTSVIRDRDSGRSRGFGFVTFTRVADAEAAIEGLNNTEIDGRPVRVDMASDKDMKRDGPSRMGGGGRGGRPMGGGRSRRDDRDAPRGGRDDYDGSWNDRRGGDSGRENFDRGSSGGYGRNRERSPGGGDRFRRPSGDGRGDRPYGDGGRRSNGGGGGRDYEGGRGGRDFKPRGGSGGGDDAGWGAGDEGGAVISGGW